LNGYFRFLLNTIKKYYIKLKIKYNNFKFEKDKKNSPKKNITHFIRNKTYFHIVT